MKTFRPTLVLMLWLLASLAAQAEEPAPVVPKPRKRLGPSPSREIGKSDGTTVVGNVQTIEKQFLNTFQGYVAATYTRLTSRLPDEPSISTRYDVRMTLNTETNEAIEIKISGNLSERRRLLLLQAIAETCKAVVCPAELRKKYGKVLDFSFDLVVNYQSGNR